MGIIKNMHLFTGSWKACTMLVVLFIARDLAGQVNSIPKTGEPLMIESKKKPAHQWI